MLVLQAEIALFLRTVSAWMAIRSVVAYVVGDKKLKIRVFVFYGGLMYKRGLRCGQILFFCI